VKSSRSLSRRGPCVSKRSPGALRCAAHPWTPDVGLELAAEKRDALDEGLETIVVTGITSGPARKSGRVAVGDLVIAINDTVVVDLPHALRMLKDAGEVKLELLYGYIPEYNSKFDPSVGRFVFEPPLPPMGAIRRSHQPLLWQEVEECPSDAQDDGALRRYERRQM